MEAVLLDFVMLALYSSIKPSTVSIALELTEPKIRIYSFKKFDQFKLNALPILYNCWKTCLINASTKRF